MKSSYNPAVRPGFNHTTACPERSRRDAESRLVSTAGWNYTYDADGQRVRKLQGTDTNTATEYVYFGGEVLAETDGSGTLLREYVYFGGKRVARRDASTGTVHYYLSDQLGSSDVVASAAGAIEEESEYYPFGGERVYTDTLTDQNYKFTGKERDGESGLDYFGARYYANTMGRWMSPDWSLRPTGVPYANFGNPQSLNLYSYVNNNPTTTRDTDGHCPDGMDVCFMPQLASDPNYMAGLQKGEELGALILAGGAALAGAWEAGGVLLRNLVGLGLANAPQIQRAAGTIADMASPPGTPSFSVAGAAEAFGFKWFESAGGLVGGELKNGATAAVNFSKTGSELGVGISFVKGPVGTLGQLESGAINAGKAAGAESVKITASMVKDSMARLLTSQGFTQEMKNGKATGNWIKKIKLKKTD